MWILDRLNLTEEEKTVQQCFRVSKQIGEKRISALVGTANQDVSPVPVFSNYCRLTVDQGPERLQALKEHLARQSLEVAQEYCSWCSNLPAAKRDAHMKATGHTFNASCVIFINTLLDIPPPETLGGNAPP